jgi:hypothetical protein
MDFDLKARATSADLFRIVMEIISNSNVINAYFSVAGQPELVKVYFPHADIFRVIDDFHIPLEQDEKLVTGRVSNHFAYRVEGAPFWAPQQETFEVVMPGSKHYRFVTGGNCLDVVSSDDPIIKWVSGTDG